MDQTLQMHDVLTTYLFLEHIYDKQVQVQDLLRKTVKNVNNNSKEYITKTIVDILEAHVAKNTVAFTNAIRSYLESGTL